MLGLRRACSFASFSFSVYLSLHIPPSFSLKSLLLSKYSRSTRYLRRKTGLSGFGFVELKSSRYAEDALQHFNGKSFMGARYASVPGYRSSLRIAYIVFRSRSFSLIALLAHGHRV